VLDALAWTNLLLAVLNLLPGAPLDGGAIVKSTVWKLSGSESSGAKAAGYAGLVIAAALGVVAVIGILGGSTGILLTAVLAAFIGFGAYQSLKAAKQHGVLDQVSATLPGLIRPVLTVSEREMLGAALDRWDRTRQAGVVTVDGQGRLLAALSLPAAEAVPAVRRDEVEIGPFTLAITADQRVVLGPDPSTMVAEMADSGQSLVFVSDENGRPLGILTAADVNRALGQR
jgi:CBS domain-containing protein